MKKLMSCLLIACLLLGAVSALAEETTNPYKGKELKIYGAAWTYMFDEEGNLKNPLDSNAVMKAAMDEWCAAHECTWVGLEDGDATRMMALINSGNAPDLYIGNNSFPSFPNMGLMQPISADFAAKMGEKYGAMYVDLMNYKGDCYGVVQPWNSLGAIQYNRTMMEDMGVKTPREYYEEGNWTYATFRECLKNCTTDEDGDGKLDTVGISIHGMAERIMPAVKIDEDGKLSSTLDTERSREFYQMLYEAVSVDKSVTLANAGLKKDGDTYVMMRFWQVEPYMLNTLGFIDNDGYAIETVPVPVWKQGDTEQSASINYCYMMLPTGSPNPEAAMELMDFILECGVKAMDDATGGLRGCKFEGLQGTTDWTKDFLEKRAAKIAETNAVIFDMPEYDEAWITEINRYFSETKYHMWPTMNGVDWNLTSNKKYASLWSVPSATSIAELAPVHQAQCDKYNDLYIFE